MTEPIVLVHGFTGHAESFDLLLSHLAAGTEALALTLPGHDPDAPLEGGFDASVDALAARIERATGGRAVHLAGYSMGARISLGILARHAGLVARATLVGVHPGLPDGSERWARAQWEGRWIAILEHEGLDAFLSQWEALPLFDSQARAPEENRKAQAAIRRRHEPRALASAMRTMGLSVMPDLAPALSATRVPVTFVAGEDDPKFVRIARALAASTPDARLRLVAHSGHNPILEQPAALADILGEDEPMPMPLHAEGAAL